MEIFYYLSYGYLHLFFKHLNLTVKRDNKLNILLKYILLFKNTNIILLTFFNEITNKILL